MGRRELPFTSDTLEIYTLSQLFLYHFPSVIRQQDDSINTKGTDMDTQANGDSYGQK